MTGQMNLHYWPKAKSQELNPTTTAYSLQPIAYSLQPHFMLLPVKHMRKLIPE